MTGSRCFWFALFLTLPIASPSAARPPRSAVTLTPARVEVGSPELIHVQAAATHVQGEWLGHRIVFFQTRPGQEWTALAGVDVEAHTGPSQLHITALTPAGEKDLSLDITILPAHYRTGTLSVAPRFVQPSPEAQKEIEAEQKLKQQVFAASAPQPLWRGRFRAPVPAAATDSFGTRRMFNGKLASIHKGADFHAAMGTPVRAANSGTVVLARPLYFEGNCVVIDHGLGIYTLSMHFSRIDVKEGQRVQAGEVLGLSGATGRVTGPHLHWAVRWQDAYLDPIKLLKLPMQ